MSTIFEYRDRLIAAQTAILDAVEAAAAIDWFNTHMLDQIAFVAEIRPAYQRDEGAEHAKDYLEAALKAAAPTILLEARAMALAKMAEGISRLRDAPE